ncbi:MAG: DUF1150 family protein [Pseudomonadota bacterium]
MTTNLPNSADVFVKANMVYIRPLEETEAEAILPPSALEELAAVDQLFAVHNAMGDRIAIVEGRDAAFAAARAHSLEPASLH